MMTSSTRPLAGSRPTRSSKPDGHDAEVDRAEGAEGPYEATTSESEQRCRSPGWVYDDPIRAFNLFKDGMRPFDEEKRVADRPRTRRASIPTASRTKCVTLRLNSTSPRTPLPRCCTASDTVILVCVTKERSLPRWFPRDATKGWVHAEYSLLPGSTDSRPAASATVRRAGRRKSSASSPVHCALPWTLRRSARSPSTSTATC